MMQINPTLAALLEEARMLTPSGGDTVAAQVAQAAMQRQQPQPQPSSPPGIEALMPGAKIQAARSAQEAQPATQGDLNQLRQRMAQAAPSQMESGVGGLGQDIQMAEGGVVGYASEGYVDPQFPQVYENYAPRDLREPTTGLEEEELFGKTPRQRAIETAEEELLGPMGKPRAAKPSPERKPVARPPAPAPEKRKQPAVETTKPADTGVASLMGPAVPTGSERQFGEAMAAQGRMEIPAERKPGDIAAERAAYYRSQGIDPNFMQARTARLEAEEARDRAEAAERAKMVEGRGIENLISRLARAKGPTGLAALAQAQLGMEPIVAAQRAGDERFAALMRERQREGNRERAAMEDMQRALADGDIARAEKSRDTALAARNAKNATEAEMRGRYAPQLLQAETAAMQEAGRAREGALERTSREKVAQIGAASREGKEGLAEQRLALQAMRADPNYAAIVKELTEAKKLAGVSTSPTLQTRLKVAEKAARDLASSYGVTPGMMGMGGAGAPAPAGDATTRLRFDAQGNPIK